jgi:hypothetical protein
MKNLSFNKLGMFLAALSTTTAALADGGPPVPAPDAASTLGLAAIALGGLVAARRFIKR